MTIPRRPASTGGLLLALAIVQSGLVGCSLAPTYSRPVADVPANLSELTTQAEPDAARVPLSPEEQKFVASFGGDPELPELVERALAHNRDFNAAVDNVRMARAALAQQRASTKPYVAGVVEGEKYDRSHAREGADPSLNYAFGGVAISQTVDIFGQAQGMTAAARERLVASEHMRSAARAALITETLRSYAALCAAQETAEAASAIKKLSQDSTSATKMAYQLGNAAKVEANQADINYGQAQANERQAESTLRSLNRAFSLLVGYSVPPKLVQTSQLADASRGLTLPSALPSSVLLRKPEVMAAEAELKARNADIGAARAAFFPSITLTGAYGTASEDLGNLFDSSTRGWVFLPQINLPIFDFGRRKSNLDAAWIRKQAGVREYEAEIQRSFRAAADVMDALVVAQQSSDLALQRATEAEDRLLSSKTRSAAGLESAVQLRQIEMSAANQHLSRIQADRDLAEISASVFGAFYNTGVLD